MNQLQPALKASNFTDAIQIPARHLQSGIMPEVYSWLFPPVRRQIAAFMQDYPMERFLQNVHPGLDDAHLGLFDAFTNHHPEITGLDRFKNSYPLSGSSEGIFHFTAHCVTNYPQLPLYALKDEYKGYEAFANSLGRELHLLSARQLLASKPGILFISNPSARDGNFLDPELFNGLIQRHKSIVDLAYVGLAPKHAIDLTHSNILAVVTSLSKPFGLYYYRIGMIWSREKIDSLYGTKWFKNLHGIFLGEHVLNHFQGSMHQWVLPRQRQAIEIINAKWQTKFVPADVGLLATAKSVPDNLLTELSRFKRGDVYRICLTPLMMQLANDMEVK